MTTFFMRPAIRGGATMAPPLPAGRMVRLGDGGETFVRDCPGPVNSVPVVLLHGWTLTADVNFFKVFAPLSEHHRVIAPDIRMHGRGPRNGFSVDQATNDVIAVLDELDVDRAIVCGYSMGGGIAAALASSYPERVAGLVIAGTGAYYRGNWRDRMIIEGINALSVLVACGINPRPAGPLLIPALLGTDLSPERRRWMRSQVAQNSLKDILSVIAFIRSDFRLEPALIGKALPPAEYILLSRDRICRPPLQRELADLLGAHISPLSGDHGIALTHPERFATACVEAICRLDERLEGRQHRRLA